MENQSHLLKSLRIAWPITDQSRAYACHILGKLGHRTAFDSPKYLQLWATATAGKLLNFDVSQWETDLEKEADRLQKIREEYEPQQHKLAKELAEAEQRVKESEALMEAIQRGELTATDATTAIASLQRRAIRQAEDEVNQALSRRLGY